MKQIDIVDEETASKFNDMTKDKHAIVKYYATWCGFCTTIEPIWNTVVKKFISDKDNFFLFAAANEVGIPFMDSRDSVKGYPTILYLKNGKQEDIYSGSRDAKGMIEWVKSKIDSVNKLTGGGIRKRSRKRISKRSAARKRSGKRISKRTTARKRPRKRSTNRSVTRNK